MMTKEEAVTMIEDDKKRHHDELSGRYRQALTMAIEALKAQDRPIICPRCGRTFSEAEGRSEE